MKIKNNKGFTLIELLIVIAIIGVLVSVISPNLGTARQKSVVVAFKTEMDNIRKQAEIYFSNSNGYAGFFTTNGAEVDSVDTAVQGLYSDIIAKSADGKLYGAISNNDYALYGRVPGADANTSTSTEIWCVDSKGKSDYVTTDAVDQFTSSTVTQCW